MEFNLEFAYHGYQENPVVGLFDCQEGLVLGLPVFWETPVLGNAWSLEKHSLGIASYPGKSSIVLFVIQLSQIRSESEENYY